MKALVLEDVKKFALRNFPEPVCSDREVLVQVGAVGVCGTDFHIYSGAANYNVDAAGKPIPLQIHPQILGHEFCGVVVDTGSEVETFKPGDRVVADQGLNCFSQGMEPICEYCASGDSHQCRYYKESGITGLAGAMRELITVPAVNLVPIGSDFPFEEAALVEPLGCVIHAMDRAERARTRFSFSAEGDGVLPVENVLILGAGPAGLLFLQYIRQVKNFQGRLLIADAVENKLRLAEQFGGHPVNIQETDVVTAVHDLTNGSKIDFLVEATGSGSVFETMPALLKKQATVLLYGHGHHGTDLSVLNRLFFIEPTLVVPVGASGRLDPKTHRPMIYERSRELIRSKKVRVKCLITHSYPGLEDIPQAFEQDCKHPEYVKGVCVLASL